LARGTNGAVGANYDAWRTLGGEFVELIEPLEPLERALENAAVVVDALLGTGLAREVDGRLRVLIESINRAPGLRVALDIPSGLDSNSGAALGAAVRADVTTTFAAPKLGLYTTSGADHAGRVEVVSIGAPAAAYEQVGNSAELIESSDVARAIPRRRTSTHKGSAGRVIAVAGSPGKTGAALLVARGALRAGAGLVTIATLPQAADALDHRVLEEMTARIDPLRPEESLAELLAGVDAVAIGPGLGLDAMARRIVDYVVLQWGGAKVVDADAITHFAGRPGALAGAKGRLVLTPHPGEMARLLGIEAADVERNRFATLARAVERTRAVVLLKGPRTLIGAPDQKPTVNATGTPALATGGAGDILTGIVLAFVARLEPRRAASCAAHLHGLAAERWAARTGADRGLLAHEIADELPAALAALAARRPSLPV
jgi:NAD(P)H-hydrate epimerase